MKRLILLLLFLLLLIIPCYAGVDDGAGTEHIVNVEISGTATATTPSADDNDTVEVQYTVSAADEPAYPRPKAWVQIEIR